jgi:homoserine kinase
MSASALAPVRNEAGRDVACAVAYASVGNVAVGFDILGHSLAGPGDRAEVRRIESPEVRIAGIHGCVTALPTDPQKNTAGVALLAFHKALGLDYGLELTLHKGIALGSGMGGSAASCVAALVAANALLPQPLSHEALYPFALQGEALASGSQHGDNLGPMLLGGLVLATKTRLLRVPVPASWHCALVHPHYVLETRKARAALAGNEGCAGRAAPRRAGTQFRQREAGRARSQRAGRQHFRRRPQRVRLVRVTRRSRERGHRDARRLRRSGAGQRRPGIAGERPGCRRHFRH